MKGLYAICDLDTLRLRGIEPLAFAHAVLEARPAALQLRAKSDEPRGVLELLTRLVPACAARGTLAFANDRPDLAVLARADGVHLGQADPSIASARAFHPALQVGISTHSLRELSAVLAERPSYVAFGPVFNTTSKREPDPVVGMDGLAQASDLARRAGVPLVGIGGIDVERALAIRQWVDAVAVISGLIPVDESAGTPAFFAAVTRLASQYRAALV